MANEHSVIGNEKLPCEKILGRYRTERTVQGLYVRTSGFTHGFGSHPGGNDEIESECQEWMVSQENNNTRTMFNFDEIYMIQIWYNIIRLFPISLPHSVCPKFTKLMCSAFQAAKVTYYLNEFKKYSFHLPDAK